MSRIKQLEAILEENPDDPFVVYALAQEYITAGQTMQGLLLFEHLVAHHPDYVPTYYHYAGVLHGAGNRTEAIRLLEAGIARGQAAADHHAVAEMKGLLANWTMGFEEDE